MVTTTSDIAFDITSPGRDCTSRVVNLFVIPAQRIVQDRCPRILCKCRDRRDFLDRREELSQAESAADLNSSAIDREDYVGQSDQCDFPKLHAHLFRHEIGRNRTNIWDANLIRAVDSFQCFRHAKGRKLLANRSSHVGN